MTRYGSYFFSFKIMTYMSFIIGDTVTVKCLLRDLTGDFTVAPSKLLIGKIHESASNK